MIGQQRQELEAARIMPLADRPHTLYRIFDHQGRLLYVGISWNTKARLSQHASQQKWWPDVDPTRTTFEQVANLAAAAVAETAAIDAERPLHNIKDNPDAPRCLDGWPLEWQGLTDAERTARFNKALAGHWMVF